MQREYSSELTAKDAQIIAKDAEIIAKDAENSRLNENLRSVQVQLYASHHGRSLAVVFMWTYLVLCGRVHSNICANYCILLLS
jgi:hypothetical protein